ncbi:hypothetical protein FB446DRAFT_753526 [Lentinula raphanica]|nr:hypothetical protein FB446DRAFT_753526 [Lentinula raphanica]
MSARNTVRPSSPIDSFPTDIWDSDEEGWEDMPIVYEDELKGGLDEEDQRRYHYRPNSDANNVGDSGGNAGSIGRKGNVGAGNATGTTLNTDEYGNRWRINPMQSQDGPSSSSSASKANSQSFNSVKNVEQHSFTTESNYTRLRHVEEDWEESSDVVNTSRYLFQDHYLSEEGYYPSADALDDRKAITPLSQMEQTKNLLSESQRIAYVGLCALVIREMIKEISVEEMVKHKEKVKIKVPIPVPGEDVPAGGRNSEGGENEKWEWKWQTEVKLVPKRVKGKDGIERGVVKKEFREAVKNMEVWALKIMGRLYYHIGLETQEQQMIESLERHGVRPTDLVPPLVEMKQVINPEWTFTNTRQQRRKSSISPSDSIEELDEPIDDGDNAEPPIPQHITLDMRYTILTSLFLLLIADSVYDSRSRALLFRIGSLLSLSPFDVLLFEGRIVDAVGVSGEDTSEGGYEGGLQKNEGAVEEQIRRLRRRRIAMLGLATLGGGLVIGLSAGLLAPVIGVGLGTAFSTIGISGASSFLAGSAGAAVITTGGVLTGAGIAGKGMSRRTQVVRVFDVLPIHRNGRVGCVLSVPGFLNGKLDDPRLPFSVLDPVVGDVFSVLWEPEMIRETGSALSILTGEVLSQISQTVLQATVMATLMTALQWPIILTKLGYLIDNPWSNALDRARAAGLVLAAILRERKLGVRPVTLVGFSLGARVIFYALVELARSGGFGIVQDVYLLGATLSVPTSLWEETRSVVGGRYVNAYARNDWVLNYLFRASSAVSGNVNTVAGLRPIEGVQGLENVDVTDKIAGHMSYRVYMPVILEELGFKVTERWFDEVEEPDFEGDRVVLSPEEQAALDKSQTENLGWFARRKAKAEAKKRAEKRKTMASVQKPPSYASWAEKKEREGKGKRISADTTGAKGNDDDDLPPREFASSKDGSRSSTPTPLGPSSTLSVPLNSDNSTSPLPKTAGFDLEKIKAELKVIEEEVKTNGSGVNAEVETANQETVVIPAIEAPRLDMGMGAGLWKNRSEDLEEEVHDEMGEEESSPPTPPSKSPNAEYPSFRDGLASPNQSSLSVTYNLFPPTSVTSSLDSRWSSLNSFGLSGTSEGNTIATIEGGRRVGDGTGGLSFGGLDGSVTHLDISSSSDAWLSSSFGPNKAEDTRNPWG